MEPSSRREVLKLAGASAAGAALLGLPTVSALGAAPDAPKAYALPKLPYAYDALEPDIDAKTLRIHHGKHHAGYVKGLNATLAALAEARKSGDYSAIQALSRALAFHGSGHVLHTLYFANLAADPAGPDGPLVEAIDKNFGGLEPMSAQLAAATTKVAGSGWGMLAYEPLGNRLIVLQIEKHENQMVCGAIPLLLIDVWEHAYYVKYQNRRADYVKATMKHINWEVVAARYENATRPGG